MDSNCTKAKNVLCDEGGIRKDRKLVKNLQCSSCQDRSESDSEEDSAGDLPAKKSNGSSGTTNSESSVLQEVLKSIRNVEQKFDKKRTQVHAIAEMCSAKIDELTSLKKKVTELYERVKTLEKSPRSQAD